MRDRLINSATLRRVWWSWLTRSDSIMLDVQHHHLWDRPLLLLHWYHVKYRFSGCSLRRAEIIAFLQVRLTDGHPHDEKNKSSDGRVNNQVVCVLSFSSWAFFSSLSEFPLKVNSGWLSLVPAETSFYFFPLRCGWLEIFFWLQIYINTWHTFLLLINSLRNNILKLRPNLHVCLCRIIKSGSAGHVSNMAELGCVQPEVIEPQPSFLEQWHNHWLSAAWWRRSDE